MDVEGLELTSGPDRGRRSGVVLTPQGSGVTLARMHERIALTTVANERVHRGERL